MGAPPAAKVLATPIAVLFGPSKNFGMPLSPVSRSFYSGSALLATLEPLYYLRPCPPAVRLSFRHTLVLCRDK